MRHFSWLRNLIPVSLHQRVPDQQNEPYQADASYRQDGDDDRARDLAKYREDMLYIAFLGPHV